MLIIKYPICIQKTRFKNIIRYFFEYNNNEIIGISNNFSSTKVKKKEKLEGVGRGEPVNLGFVFYWDDIDFHNNTKHNMLINTLCFDDKYISKYEYQLWNYMLVV